MICLKCYVNQSRIERLEREYKKTLKKEMNILDENEFWELDKVCQWAYINDTLGADFSTEGFISARFSGIRL